MQIKKTAYRLSTILITLILFGLLSACDEVTSSPGQRDNSKLAESTNGVDPRFREFYNLLGGSDTLGVAISPKFPRNGLKYQYTAAGLMVYNAQGPRSQQYYLAPIGVELGVAEPPTHPEAPNGHRIYPGFQALYNRLGGARYVGLPLTDVHYNAEKDRIEQYFENVGFYQLESDPSGEVHLLHYGAWMCASSCNYEAPSSSEVLLFSSVIAPSFNDGISRLDNKFTGKPLTEPYTAADGLVEQIFENIVVVSAPENPGGIALRPITAMLGVSVDENNGFEIPEFFLEYLNKNSGLELSGPPVTEFKRQSDEVYRQCFSNLCLDYFPNKPADLRIRPTPLGYLYKSRFYQTGESVSSSPDSLKTITIKVWEGYPVIPPDKSQSIGVAIYDGNQAIANIEPVLTLGLPSGDTATYTFAPTREDGKSFIDLDPIKAQHGTRVDYRVCMKNVSGQEICVTDDFLIWGSP